MPTLTSPHSCDSCAHLSPKAAEVKGRICTKSRKIKDLNVLDSMLATAQALTSVTGVHLASSQPRMNAESKGVGCSTPYQTEPWSMACGNSHSGHGFMLGALLQEGTALTTIFFDAGFSSDLTTGH
ncbi:hypothetical protein AOLI_G00168300 [Acnodon oligacanthus]